MLFRSVVDPLGLVARGSTWYLVAAKESGIRTYRISRIRDAVVLEEPSKRPTDFDLASHWEKSSAAYRDQLPSYHATYLVDESMMHWIRWYRGSRLQEEPANAGRIRVRLRFDAEHEAVMFALSLGAGAELLEPEHLRAQVAAAAAATAVLYTADASA